MNIALDQSDLRPLVEQVVSEALEQIGAVDAKLNGPLAYSEAESARLLGCAKHVLRDERLRGRIDGKKIGRGWYYSRDELKRYLGSH